MPFCPNQAPSPQYGAIRSLTVDCDSRRHHIIHYQLSTSPLEQLTTMIVYRDLITGDEVLSDAFPLKQAVDSEGKPVSDCCCFFFFLSGLE